MTFVHPPGPHAKAYRTVASIYVTKERLKPFCGFKTSRRSPTKYYNVRLLLLPCFHRNMVTHQTGEL